MNTIKSNVVSVEESKEFALVLLKSHNITLTSIILKDHGLFSQIEQNKEVKLVFKETEVSLALGTDLNISLRNQIPGKVEEIEIGKLLSRVSVSTTLGTIVAIITTSSVKSLHLVRGKEVIALIKSNEMMISL